MTVTQYSETNYKLNKHFRRLDGYAKRAQDTIDELPEFSWDIKIDVAGYVELYATDLANAKQLLLDTGFTNSTNSCVFSKNNCMVWLRERA